MKGIYGVLAIPTDQITLRATESVSRQGQGNETSTQQKNILFQNAQVYKIHIMVRNLKSNDLCHWPVVAGTGHLDRQSAALRDGREAVRNQLHRVDVHRAVGGRRRRGRRDPRGDPGGLVRGPRAHLLVDFHLFVYKFLSIL